ncbi:MAG: LysR family transcriptional regulator [Gammaproteobacteria bacterium]|nr:LysR family transcriptional regulator [Gammaproteobacteria bacterium]
MNNWDDYRLLIAINEGKSLRHSAQILGINHSTVSRRILALNERFGASVVEANQNGLLLTTVGEKLLNTAYEIEKLVSADKQFQHANSISLSGSIKLSLPPAIFQYLLFEELNQFQQMNPNVILNIDSNYDIVDLDQCEADVVIRVSNTPPEHLIGHRLFPIGVNFYANKDYLRDKKESELNWITPCFEKAAPDWIKHSPFPQVKIGLRIDDLILRHQAAANGYGMIRGACYIANEFDGLETIDNSPPIPLQDIWVLTHPRLINIPRIKTLIGYLTNVLKTKQSLIVGDNY